MGNWGLNLTFRAYTSIYNYIYIYIVGAHLVEISTPDILFTIIPFCTLQDRCDNNKNRV